MLVFCLFHWVLVSLFWFDFVVFLKKENISNRRNIRTKEDQLIERVWDCRLTLCIRRSPAGKRVYCLSKCQLCTLLSSPLSLFRQNFGITSKKKPNCYLNSSRLPGKFWLTQFRSDDRSSSTSRYRAAVTSVKDTVTPFNGTDAFQRGHRPTAFMRLSDLYGLCNLTHRNHYCIQFTINVNEMPIRFMHTWA